MKLVRLAWIHLRPKPEEWRPWYVKIGQVAVDMQVFDDSADELRLLAVATAELSEVPLITEDGYVAVPDEARRSAEAALEAAANTIAIVHRCRRNIISAFPCVALETEDEHIRNKLDATKGFKGLLGSIPTFHVNVDLLLEDLGPLLADRLDGVQLLAEALAHNHLTGKLHEFIRVFERAFRASSEKLIKPLSEFLSGADLNYHEAEVKSWINDLRHPATHADTRNNFVIEQDVRSLILRIEQAAYDVLLNKLEWRGLSTQRRDVWQPYAGIWNVEGDLFMSQHASLPVQAQILDPFGSYPLDLSGDLSNLPKHWWGKLSQVERSARTMPFRLHVISRDSEPS